MNAVKLLTTDLLTKLKNNLEKHRREFQEANDGYREAVVTALQELASEIEKGEEIKTSISLPRPKDHSKEYETVIAMLEMSVDDTVELHHHEFENYVQDQWDWSAAEKLSNSFYSK